MIRTSVEHHVISIKRTTIVDRITRLVIIKWIVIRLLAGIITRMTRLGSTSRLIIKPQKHASSREWTCALIRLTSYSAINI